MTVKYWHSQHASRCKNKEKHSQATQQLYFLKQLKRARVPHAQLLTSISVIRPVLEYAVQVWHHLLTKTQTDSIESVQKRALRIIYSFSISNDIPYCNPLDVADIVSLSTRRRKLSRKCFHSICSPFLPSPLPTSPDILIYLLVFEPTPNSPASSSSSSCLFQVTRNGTKAH